MLSTNFYPVITILDYKIKIPVILWNKVHHKDNISRIFWYSDWLHNTTSTGNSIFVTNHNITSCGRSINATYQTTVEYEIWYMEVYDLINPILVHFVKFQYIFSMYFKSSMPWEPSTYINGDYRIPLIWTKELKFIKWIWFVLGYQKCHTRNTRWEAAIYIFDWSWKNMDAKLMMMMWPYVYLQEIPHQYHTVY